MKYSVSEVVTLALFSLSWTGQRFLASSVYLLLDHPVKYSSAKCVWWILWIRRTLGLTLRFKQCISQNLLANEDTGQNLPANEATCHPLVNVNKPEKMMAFRKRRHYRSMVHCGPHAQEVTNLNAVASKLLRTRFKS